jgi:hypothetical protein
MPYGPVWRKEGRGARVEHPNLVNACTITGIERLCPIEAGISCLYKGECVGGRPIDHDECIFRPYS